jgi:[NiFe] hydrogenase large subunit
VARAIIDPVTRIEGHMRVECEVEGGVVKDAWVSGTLYRGMETVLQGREPADAYYVSQRICGVCPISHGHASTMATEAALKVEIPEGARLVRNIIEGAEFLHSHVLWFYTLTALDYVDVVSALSANIADTYALAQKAGTSVTDFGAVQKRIKAFVEGGQLSIFTNGYFGHPAMKLPAELNLIAVAHYLEALEMQATAAQIIALMGGKFPHFMTSLPGGTAWMPTEDKLAGILFRWKTVRNWIANTMIPDTLAIAPFYIEAATYGVGCKNFLSWGVFEDTSRDPKKRVLPRGAIVDGKLAIVDPDVAQVKEFVEHSWYDSASGLNPAEGKTHAKFSSYDTNAQYSWVKAPRLNDKPMEAGPLSRMLVGYLAGIPQIKSLVDTTLSALGVAGKPEILISLLGRVAARNLEAMYIADEMGKWINELVAAAKGGDAKFFTEPVGTDGDGAGLWDLRQGRQDRELPGGHPVHVGPVASRRQGRPRSAGRGPHRLPDRRGREASRGAPYRPLLRSLSGLRGSGH